MARTLEEIAAHIGCAYDGDGSTPIKGVAGIRDAARGDITFLSNPRYLKDLASTGASAVVASPGVDAGRLAVIRADNPYYAFSRIVKLFAPVREHLKGVAEGARVNDGAVVAKDASVYPNAFVESGASVGARSVLYPGVYVGEGAVIGEDCILYPNVVVREGVRIGDRVIIHGGTVIGADGFGYATEKGVHHKIPQIGGVVIEDDVELGANVTVDRGALGNTVIKRGTKIDNLVMIAHNVVVGEDSLIVAQVGVSGSTELGHHVVLAGQVGVVGHLKIGDGVQVGAKSGVARDLDDWQVYSGIPAIPHKDWLKVQAVLPKLPELKKLVAGLAKTVDEMKKAEG